MNLFMTGAGGYIGGSVAAKLIAKGHSIRGLVRTSEKARLIGQLGIEPVIGALDDSDLLMTEARRADGVIDTASADHRPSVETFIAALECTDKPYLHTSGSSVIGDDVRGERATETTFDEGTTFVVAPSKQARRDIDLLILDAANKGVRSSVICPSNIYGIGRGVNPNSVQIPMLVSNAQVQGKVQIVGKGLNRWSNVHIDDLADLYLLVQHPVNMFNNYLAASRVPGA
jgi:nucleoside-diphosphate-sugar epimerase